MVKSNQPVMTSLPTPRVSNSSDFGELNALTLPYEVPGRDRSAALLLWFLETVFRLDEVEAQDAVCDRSGDAGLDAIAVDDQRQEIIVFQSKRREKLPAMLGDKDLKAFVGALTHLAKQESVQELAQITKNEQLRALLTDLEIASKIKAGFSIRAVFVTNVAANRDATKFISDAARAGTRLDVWDLTRLSPVLKQLKRTWFVSEASKLKVNVSRLFCMGSKTAPDLVYAAVRAKELVRLPGIDDSRLFAQNVRLSLGNTRVNHDILASLNERAEHKDFINFHNGLTVVAKSLQLRGGTLSLADFSVCNGCQSLVTFYENKRLLSDDLEVLVRFVKIGDDRRLPEVIAYRTNNQNAISLRDLSSNDVTQVRLKAEFDELFGSKMEYVIKRGLSRTDCKDELPNEMAGRLLLAVYVGEPWSAHQKYKIFGDLEARIFSYHITALHIRIAQLFGKAVEARLMKLKNQRMAKYGLTKFLILFLLSELVRQSTDGRRILEHPELVVSTDLNPQTAEAKVLKQAGGMVDWLITELNYTVKERGDDAYDYKRDFKSNKAVLALRNEVLKAFQKDLDIGRINRMNL